MTTLPGYCEPLRRIWNSLKHQPNRKPRGGVGGQPVLSVVPPHPMLVCESTRDLIWRK